jgi:molecular chaperone DnaK (HSP70)
MTKADRAVEEAEQKEAPAYMPDLFAKAEASLKKAKYYVTTKQYKEIRQAIIETETLARHAMEEIEAAKAKIKTEAEQTAQDVKEGLDVLKPLVAGAARKKALTVARDELQGIITKREADFSGTKEKLQSKTKEAGDELKAMK